MPKQLAHQIDRYFSHHGSPIAGLGHVIVRFSQRYGVDPRLVASTIMAETEGGLTGTGRRGQYNLTGMGGVGNMHSYPSWKASIRATAKNFGGPNYKGKDLAHQTAMWVSGGQPSATTRAYTRTIAGGIQALGGNGLSAPPPRSGGGRPGRPGRPAVPGVPGVAGVTLPNPTGLLQSLGDIVGVPWGLDLPDQTLPAIPGIPGTKATPGTKAKPGSMPSSLAGTPQNIFKLLQATQQISKRSAGYSKATARGPLKTVDIAQALDCSLSVARALQMAHLGFGPNQSAPVSGWMKDNWGKPGKGKYLTMYASDEHVFLEFKIKGKFYRFDTSAHSDPNQRSGPRLRHTQRSTAGFTARHWPGL